MKNILILLLSLMLSLNVSAQFYFAHIIDTDVTWSTDPNITGSIWIRSGATLTINSGVTVKMPQSSFIHVDVAARLVANGTTFEAITSNNTWLGISCRGTNSVFSVATPLEKELSQPLVSLNNCEVSGMLSGIWSNSIWYSLPGESANTTGGGRLQISNTHFKDNYIIGGSSNPGAVVNFYMNRRVNGVTQYNDAGFIINCIFDHLTNFGVYIHSSRNVRILGSTFNASNTVGGLKGGVKIDNGSAIIDAHHTQLTSTYCSFNNLKWGVVIVNPKVPIQSSIVREAVFNNCLRAITAKTSNYLRILSCTMTIPSDPNIESHGIHLTGSTGYIIENCHLTATASNGDPLNTYGIVIHDGGTCPNLIYRNNLIDFEYGIAGQNMNRNPDNVILHGLKYQCNTFESFDDAYYMTVLTNDPSNPSHGISGFQAGAILSDPSSPSYNVITPRQNPGSHNDFISQHFPTMLDIMYFEPDDPNGPGIYELLHRSSNIQKTKSIQTTADPHCESRLPCFGNNCPIEPPIGLDDLFASYPILLQLLISTINDGDHYYMLDLVENVNSSNLLFVYSELLNKTPSTDVLAIACANDLFYNFMVRDILVANSYGIKSQLVRDALNQRQTHLTSQQLADVENAAQSLSDIEEWMLELSALKQEYYSVMIAGLNYHLDLDEVNIDEVLSYLDAIDDFYTQSAAIMIHLEKGEISEADNVLNALQNMELLSEEYEDYELLYNQVLRRVFTDYEGDFHNLDETDKESLITISGNGTYASHLANSILDVYCSQDIEIEEKSVFNPIYLRVTQNGQRKHYASASDNNYSIRFYPNPTDDLVFFDFNNCPVTRIVISDIQGKQVVVQDVVGVDLSLDISGLSQGLYLLHFYLNNKRIQTEKLIKK